MENIVKWQNKELIIHDFVRSHAHGGRLTKFWVEDKITGRMFLIKTGTYFGYEPISEKIAYLIGKNLGMDVLKYDIIPIDLFKPYIKIRSKCKYVSICEKIDRKGCSITSIGEIKRARNVFANDSNYITNREVMYEVLSKKYIDTMFLFDAIIGNKDRHYGNVHLLRNLEGELVGAPILDNGDSLLAGRNSILIHLLGFRVGEVLNKSATLKRKHDKQVETISELHGINYNITDTIINILNDIEPTLALLPKYRALAVKKYLIYRLRKYLGMLK